MSPFIWTSPDGAASATLLLAHGAGAPMDSAFMNRFAQFAAAEGVAVARFEFPYMAQRREGGKKRPPPRAELLMSAYENAALAVLKEADGPVLIGGKSMGGRVAAMYCGAPSLPSRVIGLFCLGYPFHPPAKPDVWRMEPLEKAKRPTLILQGERDQFGSRSEIEAIKLPQLSRINWLEDGNHDLAPRGRSPATLNGNIRAAAARVASFAAELS